MNLELKGQLWTLEFKSVLRFRAQSYYIKRITIINKFQT